MRVYIYIYVYIYTYIISLPPIYVYVYIIYSIIGMIKPLIDWDARSNAFQGRNKGTTQRVGNEFTQRRLVEMEA